MRCSMFCPENAIHIGFLEGWRVNGPYDFDKIRTIENNEKIINDETKGFFRCYNETYKYINERHKELFEKP